MGAVTASPRPSSLPAASRGGWRLRAVVAGLMTAAACTAFAPAAQAALFEDDEARRAILDLRQRLDQNAEQDRARQAELTEQNAQLRRSLLELNTLIETLRGEIATLRGQGEQWARDLSEVQRRQKDLQQALDERMRRVEPQQITLDEKQFTAEPDEKRSYDDALAAFRKGDFTGAANAFAAFQKRWPASGYRDSALFWLGNAQYGNRAYKEAMTSFRTLVANAPDSPRAPEALLSIANCQIELKDARGARRSLEELLKTYPKSEAAEAGRERLASLK